MVLHDPPQRFLGELSQRPPRPRPVAALPQPLVHVEGYAARFRPSLGVSVRLSLTESKDPLGGLHTPGQRRRHEPDGGQPGLPQPPTDSIGLLATDLVEVHAGQPSGEHAGGVGGRSAMTDEQDGGHAVTVSACLGVRLRGAVADWAGDC